MEEAASRYRVAANVLNKKSQIIDNGLSSSLGFRQGVNSYHKNQLVTRHMQGLVWTHMNTVMNLSVS
jgi:hypothetical protein